MCVDPVTAMVIGGGVLGAVGNLQAASAQSSAYKAQAIQARAQEQQVSNKTSFDIDNANRRYEKNQGTARAIIGQSGINPSSFGAVLDDAATQHALEVGAIRQGGDANKASLETSARMSMAEAKSAKTAGYIGAFGSVLGAGTNLAKINARQNVSGIGDFDTQVYPASGVSFGSIFGPV